VFARFEETLKKATAFKIVQDHDKGPKNWLVQHTSRSDKIVWGQHQFQVMVDEDNGVFECECKQLEHTGMIVLISYTCSYHKITHYMSLTRASLILIRAILYALAACVHSCPS
jgi:hypothetical protein